MREKTYFYTDFTFRIRKKSFKGKILCVSFVTEKFSLTNNLCPKQPRKFRKAFRFVISYCMHSYKSVGGFRSSVYVCMTGDAISLYSICMTGDAISKLYM